MSVRARTYAGIIALLGVVAAPAMVQAYLSLGTNVNGRPVTTRWSSMPIKYFVTNRAVTNVTAAQLQSATAQSFATWAGVATATTSSAFAGFTNAEPQREDGATVIGFQSHSDMDRTLGVTSFTVDKTNGALVEADIFLNSLFDWSTAANGETNRYDVQSVVTHEVGHLLGLGHSLLGETEVRPTGGRRVLGKGSVMFPIAFAVGTIFDRTLQPDDRAGISITYPTTQFQRETGSVFGRVTLDGVGIFGAHVIAFNTKTQEMIGGFTLNSLGQFTIDGLAPGVYVLRAEPMDDADTTSFFDESTKVEVGFKVTFLPQLVAVPKGGSGNAVEIKVARK